MRNREEAENKLNRIKTMKDMNKIVCLLEIMIELLLDIRFGDKNK